MANGRLVTKLEPRSIFACKSPPEKISFITHALQHQVDVFEKSRDADIILNLTPTGTGKTKAGLTVLLHQHTKSAVYIAPTNALVEQQREAAQKFVKEAGLPHVVKSASAREIKTWADDKVGRRPGEKLYNVLLNPATIFPEVGGNRPILLVTNPDIFYYATFFAYNKLDKGNIASTFYTKFATVIFDEFHLYDAKQLVGLLFYLAYSHIFGFFKDGRRVVLLTATPERACESALESLKNQEHGVRIVRINGETGNGKLLPSQTAVNLELRPQPDSKEEWLAELASEVIQRFQERPQENGAVILDSLDSINRLKNLLDKQGLTDHIGRITGPAPLKDRQRAMQCQIILATSTVDVGFNFERNPEPTRQNLDWLIFSAHNRAAFWQRIGRVGRVLGKPETNIDSEAIAYLPAIAWEQGLASLDTSRGRTALEQTLDKIPCLDKPFLLAYWRSEAFLEIARPLLELEEVFQNLPGSELIPQLFETLKSILGGNRTWDDCRFRMKVLRGAENISKASLKDVKNKWKFLPGGQAFVKTFIKAKYPEDWEDLQNGITTLQDYEPLFKKDDEAAKDLQEFAEIFSVSYAPLFNFRGSLFESLPIRDPHGYLLDESEETRLDPVHLLRYYEFVQNGEFIEVTSRSKENYELIFHLSYPDTWQEFVNTQLNKLTAFKNCRIERQLGGAIQPTPLIKELEKYLIPGVIISEKENQYIIFQMRREGIVSYPIIIRCSNAQKEYRFLPGIAGILTMAMKGKQLRLPDDEPFIV
ncbi:type I-D CRISPR-associated helicase Cas3' [Aetokthonos hydrillicola Thurmond2011]|jgi:CRISPR-associated endonuclease/helicase Cas3|uniref:Type I-D CRISPR-associated helicase Cas3 n=1 Tax=Aetokthonos hydrillicola Thurmond2011 TaxID=2712845 RepID=A0AAP5M908_9CYAN|nr:type I-D CRISPR-associated helicase Cas3' [Aetokthonos hydrillicola]MBO3458937.1 type I-D CRISPR-associated helicase Cas3' [Aetokthonos hydrillicola CCALA 1050]MBW4587212.1 type I-D CRISPR-associated helicase Cas3' [Aetokthonos hydrillicola CCALA 1050]MDR9896765.1 type I-D CRISPR-associated helicase Cas3' [Aetokthonos hydrillicola Thurmond2011]